MQSVTIYTTSWCGECHIAKRFFDTNGVVYDEVDIEDWDQPRDDLEQLTGNRTVPQIVIDGRVVGGYDALLKLTRSGELGRIAGGVAGD